MSAPSIRLARGAPGRCCQPPAAQLLATVFACGLVGCASPAFAEGMDVQFNSAFLPGAGGTPQDLSRFEHAGQVPPGSYAVEVYVNQTWIGRQSIRVEAAGTAPRFCFRREQIDALGVDGSALAPPRQPEPACLELPHLLPESQVEMDLGELRLDVSVPQAYLRHRGRGYVDPAQWEEGVTAAFVDYNADSYRSEDSSGGQQQDFLGLKAGLNVAGWRLRHAGNYSRRQSSGQAAVGAYQGLGSYLQRDLTAWRSQLTLGEISSPGDLFESVRFSGLQLTSDERMLPDAQRGFAPVIRGSAETNARVTVRQNGSVLFQTTLAPGPFVIDDLPSGGGGDLDVTLSEADGRERRFSVPYTATAQLLRPGAWRYQFSAGRYRDPSLIDPPAFIEAGYRRGIDNRWTASTGSLVAENYLAVLAGAALSSPAGALSLDIIEARACALPTATAEVGTTGRSWRLGYSKQIAGSGTGLSMSFQHFDRGYLGLAGFAVARSAPTGPPLRPRNRLQVNLSQPLRTSLGSLYLSGAAQDDWFAGGRTLSYQAGYSNRFSWGGWNLSLGRTLNAGGRADDSLQLSVFVALGDSANAPELSSSWTRNGDGSRDQQVGLSGSVGESGNLGYGLFTSRSLAVGQSSSARGVSLDYRAASARLGASYSAGEDYRQFGLGLVGSVLVHGGGLNFTQDQGETRALVHARDAAGARLPNSGAGAIAANGYGVQSNLLPYRENPVELDPSGLPLDVELEETERSLVPRFGAIVLLEFPTLSGTPVLLHLVDEGGGELPVGAEILDEQAQSLGLLGQGGLAFLHARQVQGRVRVRWGEAAEQQCQADYRLPPDAAAGDANPFVRADAVCRRQDGIGASWPGSVLDAAAA